MRIALNVPVLEGVDLGSKGSSPVGKNANSPEMARSDLKVPLNTIVPDSRPTLPIGNSIGPQKVTRLSGPAVHLASAGLPGSSQFDLELSRTREPLPDSLASKRTEYVD